MAVLIGECSIYSITWIWPQCLGLGLDTEELVKTVQRNYGSTGEDQLTAAVDLVQTSVSAPFASKHPFSQAILQFNCCGINSANEYDTSLWRLQGRSPPFAIPLTCCVLKNRGDDRSYLNPLPINVLRCQALEKNRHEGFRHMTVRPHFSGKLPKLRTFLRDAKRDWSNGIASTIWPFLLLDWWWFWWNSSCCSARSSHARAFTIITRKRRKTTNIQLRWKAKPNAWDPTVAAMKHMQ